MITNSMEKLHEFKKRGLSLLILKDGQEMFASSDPMLDPLLRCLQQHRTEMASALAIDKIVGSAAAFLLALAKVNQVITPLASETAMAILERHKIAVVAEKTIPLIKNRDGSDICPMEKLARQFRSPQSFYRHLLTQRKA